MRELINKITEAESGPLKGDIFVLELNKVDIETEVLEVTESGDIVLLADDQMLKLLKEDSNDPVDHVTFDVPLLLRLFELMRENVQDDVQLHDVVERILAKKDQGTLTMDDYEEIAGDVGQDQDEMYEADYHGRKVPLGKPMRGDVKKFKVYVRNPKTGNIKKVNFGDKKMRIKKSNPKRRKSFRARHRCANPGPRTMARYWSCRKW